MGCGAPDRSHSQGHMFVCGVHNGAVQARTVSGQLEAQKVIQGPIGLGQPKCARHPRSTAMDTVLLGWNMVVIVNVREGATVSISYTSSRAPGWLIG